VVPGLGAVEEDDTGRGGGFGAEEAATAAAAAPAAAADVAAADTAGFAGAGAALGAWLMEGCVNSS